MEYLGCFRDHPGHLREFNGAGGRHEAGEEEEEEKEAMEDREHIERENAVFVFPRSLTPKVRISLTVKYKAYLYMFWPSKGTLYYGSDWYLYYSW